jgi:hypothetical protein
MALTPAALSTAWFTTPLDRKQVVDRIKSLDQQNVSGLSLLLLLLYQRVEKDDYDLYRDFVNGGRMQLAKAAFRRNMEGGLHTADEKSPGHCQQWLYMIQRFILFDRFTWVHRCQADHILTFPRHQPHEKFPSECKIGAAKVSNRYMNWMEGWENIVGEFAIASSTSEGNATAITRSRKARHEAPEPNVFADVAKKLFRSLESTAASEHTRLVRLNFLHAVLAIIAWFLVCIFS